MNQKSFGTVLVWCFRNPLNNLSVIPGKLAILARPGIQEFQRPLDARFREHDGRETWLLLRTLVPGH